MIANKNEIDFFSLIDFFLKNIKKIILFPFLLASLFFLIQFFLNYYPERNQYRYEKIYYINDVTNDYNLNLVNISLSRINNVFEFASLRLNFLFTEFILNPNEQNNANPEKNVFNDYYLKAKPDDQYINNNFIILSLLKMLNEKENDFEFSLVEDTVIDKGIFVKISFPSSSISSDESNTAFNKFSKISNNINNVMFQEIDNLIIKSLLNYEVQKNKILQIIKTLNKTLTDSYKKSIEKKILDLKDGLEIANELGLIYPLEITNQQILVGENFTKGTMYIEKKIEQLTKKLTKPINIAQLTNNNTYYDLIESDFYKKLSIDELQISFFDKKDKFIILQDYGDVMIINTPQKILINIFKISIIIFISSFILVFILLILLNLYKNMDASRKI